MYLQEDNVVLFKLFAVPDDLPCKENFGTNSCVFLVGRQPHHSLFELIRTDETLKEFKENIIKKVEVVRLPEFKKRQSGLQLLQEFKEVSQIPNERLDEVDVFFFRQLYSTQKGGTYAPELKPSCVCKKFINPDDDTIICSHCDAFMHLTCLRQNADRKCYECKNEFPIKDIYSLKRATVEESSSTQNKDLGDLEKSVSIEQEESHRDLKRLKRDCKIVSPYPSLMNMDTALKLDAYINDLKKQNEQFNQTHQVTGT